MTDTTPSSPKPPRNPSKDRVLCTATRSDGDPCRNSSIPGGTVCRYHGGKAPRIAQAAERRLREAGAREAMLKFGKPVEVDAVTALTQELHRSAGMVEWVSQQLGMVPASHSGLVAPVSIFNAAVTPEELGNGPALMVREETESGVRYVENPLVAIYREERKMLASIASTCVKLGLKQIEVEALVAVARQELGGLLRDLMAAPELAAVSDTLAMVVRRLMTERSSKPKQIGD